jgi:hypothetical protein
MQPRHTQPTILTNSELKKLMRPRVLLGAAIASITLIVWHRGFYGI